MQCLNNFKFARIYLNKVASAPPSTTPMTPGVRGASRHCDNLTAFFKNYAFLGLRFFLKTRFKWLNKVR